MVLNNWENFTFTKFSWLITLHTDDNGPATIMHLLSCTSKNWSNHQSWEYFPNFKVKTIICNFQRTHIPGYYSWWQWIVPFLWHSEFSNHCHCHHCCCWNLWIKILFCYSLFGSTLPGTTQQAIHIPPIITTHAQKSNVHHLLLQFQNHQDMSFGVREIIGHSG